MKLNREKFNVAMARACLNVSGVAKSASMPRSTLDNALKGRNVTPVTIGRIAKALGVDVLDIIEQEEGS